MKFDNNSIESVEEFKYLRKLNKSKFYSGRNEQHIEFRECLLQFCAELFVFRFAIHKHKDQDK